MIKPLLIVTITASAVTFAPVAQAEVSAACWAHLAGLRDKTTTAAADVRYHRMRGEASACNEQEAREADGARSAKSDERKHDEGKSRYCRKHWYC